MKNLIVIILLTISLPSISQTFPKGLPSPNSNGYSKIGYSQFDSGMIQIQRDTFNAKYPTVIRYLDGNLWQTLGNGARWFPLKGASISAIYAGYGLTKINDSTLRVDSSLIATRLRVQKAVDSLGAAKQSYDANTTILGNATTGTGSIVRQGSPALTLPSISAITVSGGIAALPTGSGTLAYTSALSAYKLLNDSNFNTGFTTRARLKQYGDSLSLNYYTKTVSDSRFQPIENQRLSTTNSPTFANVSSSGYVNATGEIYSATRIKTTGSLQLDTDSTGLKTTTGNYRFYAVQAGLNSWYTPQAITANQFKKIGGTSSQFLMADGSVTTGGSTLASAQYTPTLGSTTSVNISASSVNYANYMRMDNIVIVYFSINVTPTANATNTEISIDLPIGSSTGGYGSASAGNSSQLNGIVKIGSGSSTDLKFTSTGTASVMFNGSFSYFLTPL